MSRIAAIVIGRNEGERLKRCLAALGGIDRVIYIDSGSTDGSVEHARSVGAEVVALDLGQPFTAARARNAGIARLRDDPPDLVQFLDGDCEMREGWITAAEAFLRTHPQAGIVCGRRRERFPEASRYNRLIDLEWDTPPGQVKSCGGDALMRWAALAQIGGYDPGLIAGEEPELCVRLRRAGWQVWRIDQEMTWHDAGITRLSQWWRRARRAGHAFAEGAALHGAPPERHNVAQRNRALIWGLGLPVLALLGALVTPWTLLILLLWPLQVLRLARRSGDAEQALFLTLGKIPEALGVLDHYWRRLTGRGRGRLIEYK
jgi:GT2 family glycosyltransferase